MATRFPEKIDVIKIEQTTTNVLTLSLALITINLALLGLFPPHLQDDTNHRRNELNAIRESIREKHLAVEKVKAEKEAELLAASQDGGRESKSVKGKGAKKKK